jgi:hypothetical protein
MNTSVLFVLLGNVYFNLERFISKYNSRNQSVRGVTHTPRPAVPGGTIRKRIQTPNFATMPRNITDCICHFHLAVPRSICSDVTSEKQLGLSVVSFHRCRSPFAGHVQLMKP